MHLSGQAHMLLNKVISINLGFLASGDDGSSPETTECAQEVLGFRGLGCMRRPKTNVNMAPIAVARDSTARARLETPR
jgi:hypothetical protein